MKLIFNWIFSKVRRIDNFLIPFIIFVLIAIVTPALFLLTYSFKNIYSPQLKERLTDNIFYSLLLSFFVAFCSLIITLFISFPMAILIWFYFSDKSKRKIFLFLIFPLLSNYFIKLIGLKSTFDFFNGSLNSTFGIGYTIIGLTYLSLPLVTYNFINILSTLPKEKSWAMKDLGYTFWGELFYLIFPWSKAAFWSSSILFFLPSLFSTFISEFLNHDQSTQMIGEVISDISNLAINSNESKSFIAFLTSLLFTIVISFLVFSSFLMKFSKKSFIWIKEKITFKSNKKIRQKKKVNLVLPKLLELSNI